MAAARTTGAIVVGGDFHGLGIVRSLGRRGIPVCVLDDERSIAPYSRYVTHAVRVPDLRDEARSVAALIETGERLGLEDWVVFPTRDETVAALSRHRAVLSERFRVPTAEWDAVRWAWDKRNTYRLAAQLGIPAPRTWYPRDVGELEALELELPVALKPAVKERFIYATKKKAWRADTRAQLRERFLQAAALVEPGEVMVQDLVPGDGRAQYAYCAFFRAGEAVGSMVVRRRRQHPPEFGRASTFVEVVDVPELEERSTRLLRAIDYHGLAELEYKRDPRDGEFQLLDFNARTWGYHALGQRAGVDFPYLLYADQLGLPVEPARAEVGLRWVRLVTDLPTGALELGARRIGLRAYVRSVLGANVESVFCRDDPRPGLAELALVPYLYLRKGY